MNLQTQEIYRQSVLCVCISETLDVVKDKPRKRNDHEDDEGDRYKEDRSLVDVVVGQMPLPSERDLHHQLQRGVVGK